MSDTLTELQPLLQYLTANIPVQQPQSFPKGTIMPDGRLDLCKQAIGAAGCQPLRQALVSNNQIASLLLGTNAIEDAGAFEISDLIENNQNLEVIYLGCNGISASGIEAITKALSINQSVTGLWLKRNPLGVKGADYLVKLLLDNHYIQTLDLVNTALEEQGLKAILEALITKNRTIKNLYLGGNKITDKICELLVQLLRENQEIKGLFLNVNHLGDAGIKILAKGLEANQTLRELSLASNGITSAGYQILLKAIEKHPSLNRLDLGRSPSTKVLGAQKNFLDREGIKAIADYLQKNPSLLWLNLTGSNFDQASQQSLQEALSNNYTFLQLIIDGELEPNLLKLLQRNQQLLTEPKLLKPRHLKLIESVYR